MVSCELLEVEHLPQSVGQSSASHGSTESEVTSLDVGQRMDGSLALDLWDLVIEVLRTTKDKLQPSHISHQETGAVQSTHPSTRKLGVVPKSNTKTQHVTRSQKVDQPSQVDHVPTNTRISQGES